jgi:uncharacterized protein
MVELTEITLHLPQLPDSLENLCLLHIGDLHARRFGRHEQQLCTVLRQECDLLLCTGDSCHQVRWSNPLYDSKHGRKPMPPGLYWREWVFPAHTAEALDVWKKFLKDVHCPLGVYCVQGNHDPDEFMRDLPAQGVAVLNNEARQITLANGGRFNLAGVQCFGRATADLPRTLLQLEPKLFTIALCHYPEMAEALAGAGVDLILAGHTHGGQICLPNRKPLASHSRTGGKYVMGLERIFESWVYTTRGLGRSTLPLRLFCPPEITRFTLHCGPLENTIIRHRQI